MQQTPNSSGATSTDDRANFQNGSALPPAEPGRPDTAGAAAAGKFGATAHNVIHKVADSAHPAVDRLASTAHQTLDRLASAADTTVDTIGRKGSQLIETQDRLAEACRGYVRANPLAAVGIAAAAGFLLHYLASTARTNRES